MVYVKETFPDLFATIYPETGNRSRFVSPTHFNAFLTEYPGILTLPAIDRIIKLIHITSNKMEGICPSSIQSLC
jgi:hypothetical protein